MFIKNKNMAFSLILMCFIVVSPMANAQFGGLPGTNILNIQGLVTCSINGSVSTNGTVIPPFAGRFYNLLLSLKRPKNCNDKPQVIIIEDIHILFIIYFVQIITYIQLFRKSDKLGSPKYGKHVAHSSFQIQKYKLSYVYGERPR